MSAIQLLQDDHGNQGGWAGYSVGLVAPAGATYLAVCTASSAYGSPPSITWNGVSLTSLKEYGGANKIAGLKNPAIGSYTLAIGTVGDRGSCWQALWLKRVNLGKPVRTTGDAYNNTSPTVTGAQKGDYLATASYSYWSSTAPYFTGSGFTTRDGYSSGYGQASCVGEAAMSGSSLALTGYNFANPDCWHSWVVFAAQGGGSGMQVIIERWKNLLDDIRQARIPPELLLRRYREAVQI